MRVHVRVFRGCLGWCMFGGCLGGCMDMFLWVFLGVHGRGLKRCFGGYTEGCL